MDVGLGVGAGERGGGMEVEVGVGVGNSIHRVSPGLRPGDGVFRGAGSLKSVIAGAGEKEWELKGGGMKNA